MNLPHSQHVEEPRRPGVIHGLRWWIIDPVTGKKIVLWDYQGSSIGIPQNQTQYRMNFWHTNEWGVETNLTAIEKPLHPYELEVDWMSYDPFQ